MNALVDLQRLHKQKAVEQRPGRAPSSKALVALALVKNEGDIISSWISHVLALFDSLYIVDHSSHDGTTDLLLEQAIYSGRINLFSFGDQGYYQQEITNTLADLAVKDFPDSWLVPLDADEFIGSEDSHSLAVRTEAIPTENLLQFFWRDCIPLSLLQDAPFHPGIPSLLSPKLNRYFKVGLHSSGYRDSGLRFTQGNHAVVDPSGRTVTRVFERIADIYHVPLRSIDHFALKCIQGCLAYEALPPERQDARQGFHWADIISRIIDLGVGGADYLRGFAESYGEWGDSPVHGRPMYSLIADGWSCGRLPVYFDMDYPHIHRREYFTDLTKMILGERSNSRLKSFFVAVQKGKNLDVLTKRKVISCSSGNKEFEILPKLDSTVAKALPAEDFFFETMRNLIIPHDTPTPSAWSGHEPFLFLLISVLRPRRFVELGSYFGNSFFAACQAVHNNLLKSECIAIDTWLGDHHAGIYDNNVFEKFSYVLQQRYIGIGKYLRKSFEEASRQFARGSIDLLHIDGLHTYDAVSNDFSTWLPKMSEQGIILLHDTKVYERDFGVWRLWEEISGKYKSFEFTHSHGLGVFLVGENPTERVQSFMDFFSNEKNTGRMQQLFIDSWQSMSPKEGESY